MSELSCHYHPFVRSLNQLAVAMSGALVPTWPHPLDRAVGQTFFHTGQAVRCQTSNIRNRRVLKSSLIHIRHRATKRMGAPCV